MELRFGEYRLGVAADETVLQALTRQGIAVRSSCRGGVCQTCVMRCLEGDIPARSQSGLNAELVSRGYFMPCVCKPSGDMVLAEPLADDFFVKAQLEQRIEEEGGITLLFEPLSALSTPLTDVMLRNSAGQGRYPLANKPEIDYYYAVRIADDDVSELAQCCRKMQAGEQIEMRAVQGDEPLVKADRPKDPPTDPEMWQALGNGVLLTAILEDFYDRVYKDPQLKSFFTGFTQQRLVEKQYSFLQQVMTGNKVYFGNRPRSSHHWMVISDALMDHREQIMVDCMRAHGLDEKWVKRWRAMEEYYRPDIVKSEPVPRLVNGVELPLEGFEELVIDEGCMCDGCARVIEPGEKVRYHVRLGTLYCSNCNTRQIA